MASTFYLKDVLDGNEGQERLKNNLLLARIKLQQNILKVASKANIKELEKELNSIFYPPSGQKRAEDIENYFIEATKETISNDLKSRFENFDFNDNTNKQGHYEATQAISPRTLKNAIDQTKKIKEQLESLPEMVSNEKIKQVLKDYERVVKAAEKILNDAKSNLEINNGEYKIGQRIRFSQKENYKNSVIIMNQLIAFSDLASNNKFVTTPQDAGNLFEEALASTNVVKDMTDDAKEELLKKVWTGAENIKRGVNKNSLISWTVENVSKQFKEKTENMSNFKLNKDTMTITYKYDPGIKKQGKMDVQLKFEGGHPEDYRVSAKRWTNSSGDLGETSIDAGLNRSVGKILAQNYYFGVLKPQKDQFGDKSIPTYKAFEEAHELAELALKSDIAMGLNQGKQKSGAGYANLLIVDTGESIKVLDVANIIFTKSLSSYNRKDIEEKACANYSFLEGIQENRTTQYLMLMSSALNQMKATINLRV